MRHDVATGSQCASLRSVNRSRLARSIRIATPQNERGGRQVVSSEPADRSLFAANPSDGLARLTTCYYTAFHPGRDTRCFPNIQKPRMIAMIFFARHAARPRDTSPIGAGNGSGERPMSMRFLADRVGSPSSSGATSQWRLRSAPIVQAVTPALVVFLVHACTLAPTVTGEDSGELITAAYFFGVPHPPGYPLWTILCGAWLHLIPFGSVAWRANLFSAACTSLAVGMLAACLRRLRFRNLPATVAAVSAGLTAAVWSQSVIAEVYTLNLAVMSLLMWLVVRWRQDGNLRWLRAASFVLGLGMCNHHILGFAALALVIYVVSTRPGLLRDFPLVVRCFGSFVIGLMPYGFLLWAGRREVPVNWGEVTTFGALWEHVTRGQYYSDHPIEAPLPQTTAFFLARQYYGLTWLVHNFTPLLVPLLAAGAIQLVRYRRNRGVALLALLLTLCCGPLFLYYGGPLPDRQDEFVGKVFLTPLAFAVAIALAAGAEWLRRAVRHARVQMPNAWRHRAGATLVVAIPLAPLTVHWDENNMRRYWFAEDHARNMLACMLPNALVFPSGDHNTFPLIYLVHVEKQRPDVTIADKYGYIDLALYRDMPENPGKPRTPEQREAIEKWLIETARRPVYYTVRKPSPVEGATMEPVGIVYHLRPAGVHLDTESCWENIRYRNLDEPTGLLDYAATNILADYYFARGVHCAEQGQIEEALQFFDRTLEYAQDIKEIYNNVGSALAEAGRLDEAIGRYEYAAKLDWRYTPARWNLARIFKSAGRFDWSAKVFEDLTRAAPGDFRPFGELGFLYRDAFGDLPRARHWWYESLRLNPRQPQIIQALAHSEEPDGAPRAPPASGPSAEVPVAHHDDRRPS